MENRKRIKREADLVMRTQDKGFKQKIDWWIKHKINFNHPPVVFLHQRIYEKPIIQPKIIEDMRTSIPKKSTLRLEMEATVYAWNIVLKEAVKNMSMKELLWNMHPSFRLYFETKLEEEGYSKYSL
jgi:hypothetical protein